MVPLTASLIVTFVWVCALSGGRAQCTHGGIDYASIENLILAAVPSTSTEIVCRPIVIVEDSVTGSIPSEIGLLTELTNLYVHWAFSHLALAHAETSSNMKHDSQVGSGALTGSIPKELYLLSNLQEL